MMVAALMFGAAPAVGSSPSLSIASSRPAVSAAPVIFAMNGVSWDGFVRYWKGFVYRSDRVALIVALVGAAALFIITRGKWNR